MKATDAYAYNRAKLGDKFLGFKGQVVEDHEAIGVTPTLIRLENGISLSRITGKVIGYTNGALRDLPSYFPATKPKPHHRPRQRTS